MAYKTAEFKTAYLQREIPMQVEVAEKLVVGALCTLANGKITGATTATQGCYMVAQSDVTMGDSHVPVEHHNYAYNNEVAATATGVKKLVALFRIDNPDDIIVHA